MTFPFIFGTLTHNLGRRCIFIFIPYWLYRQTQILKNEYLQNHAA